VAALMARIGKADPGLMLPGLAELPHDHPVYEASQGSPETSVVQARLNELGANPALIVDGLYGPQTRKAVRAFQRRNDLQDDGIVGPVTWNAMNMREAA
jgi:peptidoglycan hydrolase-like protein with peptidoglycan-binding domain